MVKIPAPEAGQIPEGADSLQRQDSVPETGQQVVQIDFRALRAGDPLDVALLLPLATGGEPNGNYLEFYQGFLLGLDSVKLKYGRSVNVDLYNTARDTARIPRNRRKRRLPESRPDRRPRLRGGAVSGDPLRRGEKDSRGVAAGQYRGDEQRRAVPARARPFAQVREGGRSGERATSA